MYKACNYTNYSVIMRTNSCVGLDIAFMDINTPRIHLWQSRVEIEDYSVAYFDYIAAFKVPYL